MIENPIIITKRHTNSEGEPFSVYLIETKRINDNSAIALRQLPDEFNRVYVHGYKEVYDTDDIQLYEFKVDYSNGVVFFNTKSNGKTVTLNYYGIGYELISASRIFTKYDKYGNVLETLEEALETIENLGDIGSLQQDITEVKDLINKSNIPTDLQLTGSKLQLKGKSGQVIGNGIVIPSVGGGITDVTWSNILNKPSTFPPEGHNHVWSEIMSKPTVFPPSHHTHDVSDIDNLVVINEVLYNRETFTLASISAEIYKARNGSSDIKSRIDTVEATANTIGEEVKDIKLSMNKGFENFKDIIFDPTISFIEVPELSGVVNFVVEDNFHKVELIKDSNYTLDGTKLYLPHYQYTVKYTIRY